MWDAIVTLDPKAVPNVVLARAGIAEIQDAIERAKVLKATLEKSVADRAAALKAQKEFNAAFKPIFDGLNDGTDARPVDQAITEIRGQLQNGARLTAAQEKAIRAAAARGALVRQWNALWEKGKHLQGAPTVEIGKVGVAALKAAIENLDAFIEAQKPPSAPPTGASAWKQRPAFVETAITQAFVGTQEDFNQTRKKQPGYVFEGRDEYSFNVGSVGHVITDQLIQDTLKRTGSYGFRCWHRKWGILEARLFQSSYSKRNKR